MFETYLIHQRVDPQLRRRFSLAITAAMIVTVASGSMVWGIQKLHISRVGAPESRLLIFAMDEVPPPPPAAPPHAPVAVAEPTEPERTLPDDPFEVPDETPTELPEPRRSAGDVLKNLGHGSGNRFGVPGAGPGRLCVVGCSPQVARPAVDEAKPKPPRDVDLQALTCRVCPDPPQAELRQTGAAMLGHRGLANRVRFCVDTVGKVDEVSTAKSSGDPRVDRVLERTVRGWRFAPMIVDGRARRTCSVAAFDIHFE